MALRDAVVRAGVIPPDNSDRDVKKAYSETLSHELAIEVADALRECGFSKVKPERFVVPKGKYKGQIRIIKEKEFQGGLGPKKVDVSYSDDRHGLMLAVTIKRPEEVWVELYRAAVSDLQQSRVLESEYFDLVRELYNQRNPHAMIGEALGSEDEVEFVEEPPEDSED